MAAESATHGKGIGEWRSPAPGWRSSLGSGQSACKVPCGSRHRVDWRLEGSAWGWTNASMLKKRRGSALRDRGLAHLSRNRGAWRICGLEPHRQQQHLVQEVPGSVEGMLGNSAGARRGVEGPPHSTEAWRKYTAPWHSRDARVARQVGLPTVFVVHVVSTSKSHYEPLRQRGKLAIEGAAAFARTLVFVALSRRCASGVMRSCLPCGPSSRVSHLP